MKIDSDENSSFSDKVVDITRTRINLKKILSNDPITDLLEEFSEDEIEKEGSDDEEGVERRVADYCETKLASPQNVNDQIERELLFLEETIKRINYYATEIETSILD